MSRLHVYTVHINPSLREPYEAAEFVEEGFSWKAFVFGAFWLLYQRLWGKAFLIIVLNAALWYLTKEKALTRETCLIMECGIHLLVGFCGLDWLRARLKDRGYIIADIVTGNSLLGGQQRFFDRYFSAHGTPPFVA